MLNRTIADLISDLQKYDNKDQIVFGRLYTANDFASYEGNGVWDEPSQEVFDRLATHYYSDERYGGAEYDWLTEALNEEQEKENSNA